MMLGMAQLQRQDKAGALQDLPRPSRRTIQDWQRIAKLWALYAS